MSSSAKDALPRKRSEYVPPKAIPKAQDPGTLETRTVKLNAEYDSRQATTQLSARVARTHRTLTWTAACAAAVGAAAAYVAFSHFQPPNALDAAAPDTAAPDADGATREKLAGELEAPPQLPATLPRDLEAAEARPIVEPVHPIPSGKAATAPPRAQTPNPKPPPRQTDDNSGAARRPSSDKPEQANGVAPPPSANAPSPTPGAATGNKAWIELPERKVWLE